MTRSSYLCPTEGQMAIAAKTARFIKLDNKSQEISTLDFGNIRLGAEAVTDELAKEGNVGKIEQYLAQQGYSPQPAADGAKDAKDFYSLGADCLWVTFARDHLWWTFADPEVIWMMRDFVLTDERIRKSIGGWRNTDVSGVPLSIGRLSERVMKLASIGRTDPDAETLGDLLQLINGITAPAEAEVSQPKRNSRMDNSTQGERTCSFQVPSTLFTVGDVIKTPSAAPDEAGLYAWWFNELPNVPLEGAWEQNGFRLVYVGIASSRPESRRTLRQRLRNHCNGPIATSTLRRSLAAVLVDVLDLHPSVGPGKKVKLPDNEEERLSDWLSTHGRVAWIADATPWTYETQLLQSGPPLALNIRGNTHPFARELLALRRHLSTSPSESAD
jgi:hypothetical protein